MLYCTDGFMRGSDSWNKQYITKATAEDVYEVKRTDELDWKKPND